MPNWDDFEAVSEEPQKVDWSEFEPAETKPTSGAYGTRFRPSLKGFPVKSPDQSAFGISPEMVPSGAGTKVPWLSIPASVIGKTAAGIGGYLTSPQGATETALAATPAAPVIFAKWAYDMARGGYRSIKGMVDELGQMANEALNKGIISANQLGPVPEGKTTQEHIQRLAENAANAALMGLGAVGAAAHVKLPTKEVPTLPRITASTYTDPETGITTTAPNHVEAAAKQGVDASGPRKTRETPEFGFQVETPQGQTATVPRGTAEELARQTGQIKEEPKSDMLHSDEVKSPVEPQKALGDVPEQGAPTAVTAKAKPSEVPVRSAAEPSVAAEGTPQAMPKGGTPEPPKQAGSVTEGVTEPKKQTAKEYLAEVRKIKEDLAKGPPPPRETIIPSEDTPIGHNANGEPIYQRKDGSVYRMRNDRPNTKPNGYPDFGGDLNPVDNPGLTGMGGALAQGEIPETGAGGEKYGVAERVRAERAQAGQVAPVEAGKGMSTQQTIEMGRDIVRRDPEAGPRIMAQFEADPKKATSTEGIAVVRAHGESLAAGARTIEENYGTESPEYKQAKEYLSDWDRRSKAMQTEWHKQGMGQQGETDIDTGSFTGLERARQQATGQGIPKSQKPRAKKIAAENKQAQNDLNVASNTLNKAIRNKSVSSPVQDALDAASKTVREAAARLAQEETKARVAEESRRQAEDSVQKLASESAHTADVSKRDAINKAREETKARVDKARRDKELADAQVRSAQKALRAVEEAHKRIREKATKEAQRRANDPSIAVWEKAKEYLDENKGLYSFDDLRKKIAADLGMSPSKVTNLMARDSTIKRLAVDMWNKQRNARRLKEQAKMWLRELDTPGYLKALNTIPRSMFALSVFGHGFVALGTHAPIVAFQPRFWGAYVKNFGKMYKMVFSPAYYESQMQDLVRRDNYEVARQAGLQNDPFTYEEFHTTAIRDLVKSWIGEKGMDRVDKLTSGGNRGYGVLKLLRQDMFDQAYNRLPRNIRVQKGVAEAIADGVNHATGVTQKQGFKGSNILFFAPRLEASRVAWLATDPSRAVGTVLDWKNATTAQREFAKAQFREKGWVLGTFASLLAMNQGFLAATGSKQKINGIPEALGGAGIDPLAGDFLKFKVAGVNVAYGGALLTMAKLPARIGWAIAYEGKGSKYVLEDERAFKVAGSYIRSQMSPFAGTVTDLALGRDYEERPLPAKLFGTVEQTDQVPKRLQNIGVDEPYTWAEFAATRLPIPIAEAFKEGMRGSGMSDNQVAEWMKAIGLGIAMTGTGTRITEDTREE